MSAQVLTFWPKYITAVDVFTVHDISIHKYWYHQYSTCRPGTQGNDFRNEWRSHFGCRNRMAYSYVPISAHYSKEDAACELIYACRCHVDLTHDVPKRPKLEAHGGNEEWYTDEKAFVRNSQVDYVHVGDSLHLREAQNNVDDERVAEEAHDADESIQDLSEDVERGLVQISAVLCVVT